MPVLTDSRSSAPDPTEPAGGTPAAVNSAPVQPTAPVAADGGPTGRPRRRWPWVVVAVAGVGSVVAATTLAGGDDEVAEPADAAPDTLRTVTAEQQDLVEFDELAGRMVFADTVAVTSATDGVVTDVVADASTVVRGDVAYAVNASPVVVFHGEVPLYRPLAEGDVGDDVELLEANLASLGHHRAVDDDGELVDTEFLVDGVFDEATTEAVERWQADLGVEQTGVVDPGSVLVLDGPARVSTVSVELGDRTAPGTPLLELDPIETITTEYLGHTGDVELVARSGDELASGDVVYAVDDRAVVAIVTDETFDRDLADGVDDGDDVLVLETMLAALGYDAGGDLVVDDEFTEETTTALTEFEEDLADAYDGSVVDGEFTADEYLVVPAGTVVGTPSELERDDADVVASGSELWSSTATGSRRIVETSIAVSDQLGIVEGSVLDVEFPDGSVVPGTVTHIASSSVVDPTDPDGTATLAVEIELSTVPESAADLNELDVEVLVVDELAAGAVVVPASALVAAGDGQFAVEAITTTGTTLVPVEPGLFADGLVEVTGLPAGAEVVVP